MWAVGLSPSAAPLVGRGAELAAIDDCLSAAAAGVSTVLLLEGEAGIGKSALLQAALRRAGERRFQVASGAAVELERGLPFSAIAHAVALYATSDDERRAAVGRLIAGSRVEQGGRSFAEMADPLLQVVEGTSELVEQMARDRPVLIALEDVQWADSSSVLVFGSLARRLRGLAVLLVATLRPGPRSVELAKMADQLRRDGAVHLALDPLDEGDVATLAGQLLLARPGPLLCSQLARTGGNPLFVVELVRALETEGALVRGAGSVDLPTTAHQPAGFRESVLRGLDALGHETRELLRLAAVLGSSFSLDDLALVADARPARLLARLRGAIDAGILAEGGERLRFQHELIRDAIYESLPADVRRTLHREVARLLAGQSRSPTQVAEHLAVGARPGDVTAVAYLRQAARPGAVAARSAAEMLELALRLMPATSNERDELAADLAESLVWAGRIAEGEKVARELLRRAPASPGATKARQALLRALWVGGRWGELVAHAEPLLRKGGLSAGERGQLLADSALARLFCGDDATAEEQAMEALRMGQATADEAVQFRALYSLAAIKDFRGPTPDGVAYAHRSVELARSVETRRYQPHFGVGMCLHSSDDMDGAERAFRAGLEVGRELGTVWDLPLYHSGLAIVAFHSGRWDDTLTELETSRELADEVGTHMGSVTARAFGARVAVHRDELDIAADLVSEGQAEIDSLGPQWGAQWLLLAEAELHEARGQLVLALDSLMRLDAIYGAMIGVKIEMAPHIVRLALRLGQLDAADRATESVEAITSRAGIPRAGVTALHCRGLLAGDPDLLVEAVERYRAGPRLLERATLFENAGTVVGRDARRRSLAVDLLTAAVDSYDRLGASVDVRRAAARLRELGVHRGGRGIRRRPRSGWASLTDSERKVAMLVAEGLTNRQIAERLFISRYTVETHLKHLFTKLDLSSRVQLVREFARRAEAGQNP